MGGRGHHNRVELYVREGDLSALFTRSIARSASRDEIVRASALMWRFDERATCDGAMMRGGPAAKLSTKFRISQVQSSWIPIICHLKRTTRSDAVALAP